MAAMRREQHIDPDLFDLFLRSGVYQRYAERFLLPEQIDTVDIEPLLGPAGLIGWDCSADQGWGAQCPCLSCSITGSGSRLRPGGSCTRLSAAC